MPRDLACAELALHSLVKNLVTSASDVEAYERPTTVGQSLEEPAQRAATGAAGGCQRTESRGAANELTNKIDMRVAPTMPSRRIAFSE